MIHGNDITQPHLKHTIVTAGIVIAVLLEAYAHSNLLYTFDKTSTAMFYAIAGVCVGILPLISKPRSFQFTSGIATYLLWIGIAVIVYLLIQPYPALLASHPLDYKTADMLPIMEVMSKRFISGEHVYDKIPEIWNGMQPIYLPAMWLPFVVSSFFNFDPRWITLAAILLGILIITRVWVIRSRSWLSLIVLLPIYWIATAFLEKDTSFLLLTQEGVVIGYYLFLGYALTRNNPYLIGFSAALCLMSRFSFLFWLIAFGAFLLFSKDHKFLLRAAITGVITTLILLLSTGAIYHLDVFLGLQKTYLNAVRPANEWKYSGLLENSLGLARFWGYEGLKQLHRVFLSVNILTPILAFGTFLLFRKNVNRSLLALCILKLSLVLFYNLLIIPAGYLFYTSTFFSLGILCYWLLFREASREAA